MDLTSRKWLVRPAQFVDTTEPNSPLARNTLENPVPLALSTHMLVDLSANSLFPMPDFVGLVEDSQESRAHPLQLRHVARSEFREVLLR
jgi:hypothetical protein